MVYDADIDCVADKKEIIQKFGLKIPIQIGDSISCPLLLGQKNEFASEYKHFLESFNEKLKKAIWMYDN